MTVGAADTLRSELSADRGACYTFLARLFLGDPDPALLEGLRGHEASELLSWGGGPGEAGTLAAAGLDEMRSDLSDRSDTPDSEAILRLAVHRARLFRGISRDLGPVPPYEAVFRAREGLAEVDVLLALRELYEELGVELGEGVAERPDSLGVELGVMAYLCAEEARIVSQGETAGAGQLARLQELFLRDHLLRWVPAYCEMLAREAGCGFYSGAARLLKAFLDEEAGWLDIKR